MNIVPELISEQEGRNFWLAAPESSAIVTIPILSETEPNMRGIVCEGAAKKFGLFWGSLSSILTGPVPVGHRHAAFQVRSVNDVYQQLREVSELCFIQRDSKAPCRPYGCMCFNWWDPRMELMVKLDAAMQGVHGICLRCLKQGTLSDDVDAPACILHKD